MQKAMEEDKELGGFVNFQGGFVAVGMLVAEDKEKVDGEGSGVGDIKAFERFEGLDKMMAVAEGQTGTLGDLAKGMSHAAEEKKYVTPFPLLVAHTDYKRRYVGTLTTKPSESFYNDIYHHWQTCLKELPEGAILHYTIQPVGSQAVKYGQEQGGGNIMNLQAVSQVCKFPIFHNQPSFTTDETSRVGLHSRMAVLHLRRPHESRSRQPRRQSYKPSKRTGSILGLPLCQLREWEAGCPG